MRWLFPWNRPGDVTTDEDEQLKQVLRRQADEFERRINEKVMEVELGMHRPPVLYGRRHDDRHD